MKSVLERKLAQHQSGFGLVITPETIPKFLIPGHRGSKGLRTTATPGLLSRHMSTSRVSLSVASASEDSGFYESPSASSPLTASPRTRLADNGSSDEYSNSDPGYKLSMTLRHLPQISTVYGFSTLHSRPRVPVEESVFFPGLRARRSCARKHCVQFLDRTYSRNLNSLCSDEDSSDDDVSNRWGVGGSSAGGRRKSWADAQKKRRKAIQLPNANDELGDQYGYYSDQSSVENSPDMRRRPRRDKSSARQESDRSLSIQQLHLACARKHHSVDLGGIEVGLRYDATAKQLFVLLIHAENIGRGEDLLPKQVSSYVKVSIRQTIFKHHQVKRSKTVRKTCDPVYNEEFAFENVTHWDIKNSQLRLKVRHEKLAMPSAHIGEVWLKLAQIKQNGYMHFKEDLKPKQHFTCNAQNLKRLNIGLSYRAHDRSLQVTVVKSRNVTGPSKFTFKDCRVEVELIQVGRNLRQLDTETRHTRARPCFTRTLVFKEAFTFCLNESRNLRDGLTLICRVVRRNILGKDTTVGKIQFGVGSTQKSESDQWATLWRRIGRPIGQWHTLVDV